MVKKRANCIDAPVDCDKIGQWIHIKSYYTVQKMGVISGVCFAYE